MSIKVRILSLLVIAAMLFVACAPAAPAPAPAAPAAETSAESPALRRPGGSPPFARPKGRAPRGTKSSVQATKAFDIHGQIIGLKNGKVSVRAPNPYVPPVLTVEVDEAADIDVELAGLAALALVRPGDRISARCQQVAPNAARILQAEITLSQPLSATEGTGARKKPASARHPTKEKPKAEGEPSADDDMPPADDTAPAHKKPAKKATKPRRLEKSEEGSS